ncbi:MAG TPA: adenosine deaminase, partial [Ruania sp.]|nr:adenosine deaminase [Ruania sp.]
TVSEAELGSLASWVLDRQVPLEVCPTSNLQTGIADSIAEHPVSRLWHLGFAVTINTDNRLVSGTSLTEEMYALVSQADWTLDDLEEATLLAAWNAFAPHHVKQEIVTGQIEPAFAAARA